MNFLVITLAFLMVSQPLGRGRRMKECPFSVYEYLFNEPVIFMFGMKKPNTIGVYYGHEEQEKIASVTLRGKKMGKEVFMGGGFDGYMTAVYPQIVSGKLVIIQKSSIGVLDFTNKKQTIEFQPKLPNYDIDCEYTIGKLLDKNGINTISVFYPYITESNGYVLCQSLVLEDLQGKKTTKRLQVRNNRPPFISFFSNVTIYRDGIVNTTFLKWKAVDDSLEPTDHPLVSVLNNVNDTFRIEQFRASESQECAIVSGYAVLMNEKVGNTKFMIIPWEENRSPVPITLPEGLLPSPYMSNKTFLLSPSGKWLFFTAAEKRGDDRYFLTYIDKSLPNYYLPPIEIQTDGDDFEVTWMRDPEGFVLHTGKVLRYWDLSQFDPTAAMNNSR